MSKISLCLKLLNVISLVVFATGSDVGVIIKRSDVFEDCEMHDEQTIVFPPDFKFGAASAAYQIEGAWNVDGKGPSIWDTFTHDKPDRVVDSSNGDDATLSYLMYREDVAALKEMNSEFYRFSVSWPRVLPTGEKSSRNQLGIDYYNNLINELIDNGIEPMITMYHWDLPQALQDLGGFMNPLFVDYFEEYAELLFTEFGDRVKQWITFNEPTEYCPNGYASGFWAPGLELMGVGEYLCAHHTVLAHARAYHLYKDKFFALQNGRVGITLHTRYNFPEDPLNAAHVAARDQALQFSFGIYAHPLIHGDYPAIVRERVDRNSAEEGRLWSRLPTIQDIEYVKGTVDFIGLNYYTSRIVKPAENDNFPNPSMARDTYVDFIIDESWAVAKSSWLYLVPDGLYNLIHWISDNYNNIEIIITENGWSDDGELNDEARITYMRHHFHGIHRAIEDGCHVTGHATWSIVDNFEWAMGYTEKFGVYRVDVTDPTRARVPKSSARFLSDLFSTKELTVEV